MMTNIIHTIHIAEHIKDEMGIVNCFKLIEQEAYEKKLMVFSHSGKESYFYVVKIGKPCGDPNIFEAKNLDGLKQFINRYQP